MLALLVVIAYASLAASAAAYLMAEWRWPGSLYTLALRDSAAFALCAFVLALLAYAVEG